MDLNTGSCIMQLVLPYWTFPPVSFEVIDLSNSKPQSGLRWCTLIGCRVLVCGGDGTVGWILSTIEDMQLEPRPVLGEYRGVCQCVCIVPGVSHTVCKDETVYNNECLP